MLDILQIFRIVAAVIIMDFVLYVWHLLNHEVPFLWGFHRIHHSVKIKERDSNYGIIFSIWDRALGTLIKDIDQAKIKIGMGAYRKPEKLNVLQLLIMPFTRAVR